MPKKIKVSPVGDILKLVDNLKDELNKLEQGIKDYQYWREKAASSRRQLKKINNKQ